MPVDEQAPQSPHDRMLASAKHLFSEKGYESTTTSAIARAAGTSESQLIKHFGNKEGLLEAILEEGWKRLKLGFAHLESAHTACEKLLMLPKIILRGFEQDPAIRDLMFFEGRRLRKNEDSVLLSGGFQELVTLADNLLGEMARDGDLAPGVHPQAARSALMGALEGLLRDRVLATRSNYPAEYDDAQIDRVYGLIFAAICTESMRSRLLSNATAA